MAVNSLLFNIMVFFLLIWGSITGILINDLTSPDGRERITPLKLKLFKWTSIIFGIILILWLITKPPE